MTETAALAHVVLPAASYAEKDGTFTNTEGLGPAGEAGHRSDRGEPSGLGDSLDALRLDGLSHRVWRCEGNFQRNSIRHSRLCAC